MEQTRFVTIPLAEPAFDGFCGHADAEKARRFHRTMPGYAPTPLVRLDHLAKQLGVASIAVKDESKRFGLNAFKVLGGSYCIASLLWQRLGREDAPDFGRLTDPDTRRQLGDMTFVTATDGNHGRGIAWTAHTLGQRSVVYMPKGSAAERLQNIAMYATEASITDLCYDDTVRLASRMAAEQGWILTQDTSWPGYEDIPRRIMQGYTTMALEAEEQMGDEPPTHVFLQCGVGSMAGAVAAFFADCPPEKRPQIIVVEPLDADCMYQTALANDGGLHPTQGQLRSMMAGLCCGEPCGEAWDLLKRTAAHYAAMPDELAALGMRTLARPAAGDPTILSGESGASGFGLLMGLLTLPELAQHRARLGLDEHARILCFSTEGVTDKANWQKIMQEC